MDNWTTVLNEQGYGKADGTLGFSVGYDGRLYDCDFNQMLDPHLSDSTSCSIHLRPTLLRLRGGCGQPLRRRDSERVNAPN